MAESKDDKLRKQEKSRRDDREGKEEKARKESKRDLKPGGRPGKGARKPSAVKGLQTPSKPSVPKTESTSQLLSNALKEFPELCTKGCEGTGNCEKLTCDEGRRSLRVFETTYKTKLKDAMRKDKEKENLLHHLVKNEGWFSEEKTAPKRMFDWLSQQQEFEPLLKIRDKQGFTPVHYALYRDNIGFITYVLEAEQLKHISILRESDSSSRNCLHLAAREALSPHLHTMIVKCKSDKEILMSGINTKQGTPLHVAVQEPCVPVALTEQELDLGEDDEYSDDEHYGEYDSESDVEDEDLEVNEESQMEAPSDAKEDDTFEDVAEGDDSDADSDYKGSNRTASEGGSEHSDIWETDEPFYKVEDSEERRGRLKLVLDALDDDDQNVRPKPPGKEDDAILHIAQRRDNEEDWDNQAQETNETPIAEDTILQSSLDLPHDHSVRLLVEACPEALLTKNMDDREDKRTPYQEREHVLMNDEVVQELVEEYAKKRITKDDTYEVRLARAKRAIIVEDPVARYIRSYCIRESKSRDNTMQQLYKPGQERHIEFDLEGFPETSIRHDYLSKLGKHLQFESILRYVALPALSVEARPPRNPRNPRIAKINDGSSHEPDDLPRNGRSDLVAVFDWLWSKGVREIVKVRVVDGSPPHADVSIVRALHGFNVTVWDWKRVDLCSDVIADSSSVVKEISVYSSGNNAVLKGWASEDGLGNRKKFPKLEKVNFLMQQDGLEDDRRSSWNINQCQLKIREHWKRARISSGDKTIEFKTISDDNRGRSTTENIEQSPSWISSCQSFGNFLWNAAKNKKIPPVKIAIIDDGIDATLHNLQSKIAGGATFCPFQHSTERVNSYFVPNGRHGTLMAQLICDLCPGTELYIARLEEMPLLNGSGRRVTARSAAKAVEWAVNCGVDIISMSWTIQTAANDNEDMLALKSALATASKANIHMFGSANDQGENTKEEYFPTDKECIRIGGATFTGEKLTWVDDKVDFWFPGRNVPFKSADRRSIVYENGSSIATAAASGLAALLIYSARLNARESGSEVSELRNHPFHTRDALSVAFRTMARGTDGKFPRTDEVLNKLFKKKMQQVMQQAAQEEAQRMAAQSQAEGKPVRPAKLVPKVGDVEGLGWNKDSKEALRHLLLHIQGQ